MQGFAARCGLSKGYISMLEKGKHPQSRRAIVPSIDTYVKLAKGMGLSLDELLVQIEQSSMSKTHKIVIQNAKSREMQGKRRRNMVKSNQKKVELYEDGNFEVLITETKDQYCAWISHKDYGVAELMFGVRTAATTREKFLELTEKNLDDYKNFYTAVHIEGGIDDGSGGSEGAEG